MTSPKDTAHAAAAQVVPVAGGRPAPPPGRMPPPMGEPRAAAAGGAAESADLFDYALLRDYAVFALRAPRRHVPLALLSFASVVALGVASLYVLPKKYEVQARLLAQRNQVIGSISNPGLARPYELDAPTRAARETVLRWDNLVSLIEQTDLVNEYLRTRAPAVRWRDAVKQLFVKKERTQQELVEALAYTLENRLRVDVSGEGTVSIVVVWQDAATAYRIVDAALQNFLEVRHASETAIMGDAISVLESHVAEVQREIDTTTERIAGLERTLRPRPSSPARRVVVKRAPVIRQDSELARLQSLLASKRQTIADLEQFRLRRLGEMQEQLVAQQAIYSSQHPVIINLHQTIEQLSRPSPQLEAAKTEARDLERDIVRRGGRPGEIAPAPAVELPREEVVEPAPLPAATEEEDPRLEYERGHMHLLFSRYWTLRDRIDSARVELDTAQAAFKYRYSVITPPQMPKAPMKPVPLQVVLASIVGGIAFALFTSIAADVRSRRIVERWQIERRLGLPVLADLHR